MSAVDDGGRLTRGHGSRSLWRWEDQDRMIWVSAAAAAAVVAAVALRGLGLPGIDLHGPLHRAGVMDPLCGGTRATYVLAHGDVSGAWSWNPLVVLLAVAVVAALARVLVGWITRRWLNLHVPRRYAIVAVALLLIVVEVNQQVQADRLMTVRPG